MTEIFDQQEPVAKSAKSITLTYGLVTALAMIVLSLVLLFLDLGTKSWLNYLIYLIYAIGVFLACRAFTASRNGFVTFGNVFGAGFRMVAFTTLLMVVWSIISIYVFPEIKDKALQEAQIQMLENGTSEEQIEMGLEMTRKFFTPVLIMGAVFSYLIVGVVFSLLSAAIVKKNKIQTPF